jgi:hypothetical protein
MREFNEGHLFDEIRDLSNILSEDELVGVMGDLRVAMSHFEREALEHLQYRQLIYSQFNDRLQEQEDTDGNRGAISMMSRRRNSSKKGHNQQLAHDLNEGLRQAAEADADRLDGAASTVFKLELSYEVLMDREAVLVLSETGAYAALEALDEIKLNQAKLFAHVVQLVANRAQARHRACPGDTIQYGDFLHEGLIELLTYVTRFYPGTLEDDEAAAKVFPKFIYNSLDGLLRKFEAKNSRSVKVPRNVLDRWRPVREALDDAPNASMGDLASLATKKLYEKRQLSTGNKLSRTEAYTEDEVYTLIQVAQPVMSLNEPESGSEESDFDLEKFDSLPSAEPLPDEAVDRAQTKPLLIELLKEYCGPDMDMYLALLLKTGLHDGNVLTLNATCDAFHKFLGRTLSRSKLAEYEKGFHQSVSKNTEAKAQHEVYSGR